MFAVVDIALPFKFIVDCPGVGLTDEYLELPQVEHLRNQVVLSLLCLFDEGALAEEGIGEGLANEIQELAFAVKLLLTIKDILCEKAVSAVHNIDHLAFAELGRYEAVLTEEDIMAMHEIAGVLAE